MNKLLLVAVFVAGVILLPASVLARTPLMCTAQYEPVCGAKQVQCVSAPCYPQYHTYGNSCTLSAEGGAFIHEGECTATETGPVKPSEEEYVPPANCTAWFDGCNSCSKSTNGQSMCTLMACMGPKAPGRCTAYATPPPVVTPAPAPTVTTVTSSSTSASSSTEASSTSPMKPGFFTSIWDAIRDWLTSLFS